MMLKRLIVTALLVGSATQVTAASMYDSMYSKPDFEVPTRDRVHLDFK